MGRRERPRKSEWVEDVGHCCRSSGSKQVRLESFEHVCDASFSRRPAIRVSHVLVVSQRMPDFGRFLVLASISRILGIS